ncbi:hypothetical protein E1281_11725 [Actinomadura sp. KC345]|uniref:hypothetical protein n=1 Tax=Actinomadura sp. KC345 TaxID=2530371 RepID=UPI0010490A19|nr:hypothetical protein [Actinomadura sp. KC345]TDC55595.1 hypothetical protein E1281_11725 [Actinomadura sp. KC345]
MGEVDLDAEVAGQAIGFRLNLEEEQIASAVVLSAPDVGSLSGVREADTSRGIAAVMRASSSDSYDEQVQALMMDRLDLHPLVSSFKQTSTQTHGWPVYFGTIYLPAGRDKALLGDVLMSGLPGRLLQVFLDLPSAAALTQVKAAADVLVAKRRARHNADKIARQQRDNERRDIEDSLREARERLEALTAQQAGGQESLADLAAETVALARQVADSEETWDELMRTYRRARTQRQRDTKVVNDVTEDATARRLFHGLDPRTCPRCDQAIEAERRQRESETHACAVCSRPVTGDDDSPEEVIAEAQQRLEASTAAEKEAKGELEVAETQLATLSERLTETQRQLRNAEAAENAPARAKAREDVLRLEGALSVFPELPPLIDAPEETKAIKVLTAGVKILVADHESASRALFDALNKEIAELGRRFGIDSLESVKINRAAHLDVTKGGGNTKPFGEQSAGERLRLRIAVVIALLRVGAAHLVSTHPGLLLIDSPKAEEVQDLDIRRLLNELGNLAKEKHLQVVITTRDFELAHDVLDMGNIIEAPDGKPLW